MRLPIYSSHLPVILTSLGTYLPGFKSGGPLTTLLNLIAHLSGDFQFKILTADRDLDDAKPYPGITPDCWQDVDGVHVHYTSPGKQTVKGLSEVIREVPHDLLYLNSFFSPHITGMPLLARRLGMIPHRPVIVAPRGEFSKGALELKSWKKEPYIAAVKFMGLYRGITWQASSPYEADDIRRVMGNGEEIQVACNLPSGILPGVVQRRRSAGEPLKIVFLSRISPKKNLELALDCLSQVRVPIEFNIYGPAEDAAYWRDCQQKMALLPEHIRTCYHGSVLPSDVPRIMAEHDLFFMPTRGENYGHVIAEAICAGTPVLIADTTPWRDLAAKGIGFDLPLDGPTAFVDHIAALSRLEVEEYSKLRSKVLAYAKMMHEENEDVEKNRLLFRTAIDRVSAST